MSCPSSARRDAPVIVSFSRKTDGPRYYADWFESSWRRGWAEARNSFGGHVRAELGRQRVIALLGWTRDARPFFRCLELLRLAGVATGWQHTITAYGRDLEPRRPSDPIGAFLWLRERLPSSHAIEWRYDPIVIADRHPESFHVEAFGRIARALRGATRVCNTSIVEPFKKSVRRLNDASIAYRACARGSAASDRVLRVFEPRSKLTRELACIAAAEGIELRACTDPELGLPPSQCCSRELFSGYGASVVERLENIAPSPSRPGCRCLRSVDIGMTETCVAGCKYCYAVSSDSIAIANRARHHSALPMIRPLRA